MVVSSGDSEVGMVVDALEGEDELVVKAVDGSFMSSELVSGAAILGDGKVVLILNAFGIIGYGKKKSADGYQLTVDDKNKIADNR